MSESPAGAVIAISSHVIRGSVGNRAAVFALESLGFPVWSMPTVVLPWHPGHGPSTRMSFPDEVFDAAIDDLIRAPWLSEVKAVMTGYFGSARQPLAVARLVQALKQQNPDLVYLCDPVIGDLQGLYVPEATAIAIRDHLIPLADIATPNRYELAWMAGAGLETNAAIIDAALSLGPSLMAVTSAVPMMAGSIGNLLLSNRNALLAEHRAMDGVPNGLGDLFSALLLARLLQSHSEEKALQLATASVYEVLARSLKRQSDELTLEQDQSSLITPMALVQIRRLLHPASRPVRP
ncbi:pyridoxal kinase PdxY [Agrobacterium vitis]|uniref:pyridoxal kinase n=1 Tax=Agrobacterium vitis TaxID=373 RepID=A0A368NQ47_AGRVI|nr:pyridoxal kinase PdxY [Agrobacterium vitis]KAA3516713.1 pyridoxal kinase PdxY [Agrobacterium vitis]KAA3529478.1 pyridoxal kinase PdxY [Agrobacterium vitis]MCF1477540.1 pyridoxal kinase PdxY [Agrobacterium vitis]MUZ97266.1 pyridoxal kinase PdxY [Agrobacterium vitis]MVA28276.1 pyridoxal kinase PdxY [Agrobacterium vitis]